VGIVLVDVVDVEVVLVEVVDVEVVEVVGMEVVDVLVVKVVVVVVVTHSSKVTLILSGTLHAEFPTVSLTHPYINSLPLKVISQL